MLLLKSQTWLAPHAAILIKSFCFFVHRWKMCGWLTDTTARIRSSARSIWQQPISYLLIQKPIKKHGYVLYVLQSRLTRLNFLRKSKLDFLFLCKGWNIEILKMNEISRPLENELRVSWECDKNNSISRMKRIVEKKVLKLLNGCSVVGGFTLWHGKLKM